MTRNNRDDRVIFRLFFVYFANRVLGSPSFIHKKIENFFEVNIRFVYSMRKVLWYN